MGNAKQVQLGFIGVGAFISANHLPNAARSQLCEVRALCDINEDQLSKRAAMYAPQYVTTDYHELLDDAQVDIIVIGTKQDLHASLAAEALEAGKWVLVEKPVGETLDEMDRIVAAASSAKGKLAVGHNRRFTPSIIDAKRLMGSGEGPWFINYRVVNTSFDKESGFYGDREKLLYEGCHMFDLANYLIGQYPSAVFASGDRYRNCCVICEYDNGSRFQFLLGSLGSLQLEKESIVMFRDYSSIHIRDFTDMRVRGFEGEYDRVHARTQEGCDEIVDAAQQYGGDFMDVMRSNLMADHLMALEEDKWNTLPMEQVRRVGMSQEATRISDDIRATAKRDGTIFGLTRSNKGHFESL
jgi:predicted dehydrogenase